MVQVVRTIDIPVLLNGVPYHAQVCARPDGHMWEGWIEFIADDGTDVRRTARETTQPDFHAVAYWASGLSGTYLEGALARTLAKPTLTTHAAAAPYFDGPDQSFDVVVRGPVEVDRAVLDPFSVAAKGEDLLRRELGALRSWHLRNIIRVYELAEPSADLETLTAPELIDMIVAAVEPV
jgi:hypothetical protein